MEHLKNKTKNMDNKKKFVKDPFYDITKMLYDPILFNVKIPKGEKNLTKQPVSTNEVKQEQKLFTNIIT